MSATARLTQQQRVNLAWELQCAIVDGLGGEGTGAAIFGDLDSNEVHPTLGITWYQAMQQIAVWLSRIPGGVRHEEMLFAGVRAQHHTDRDRASQAERDGTR